MIGQLLIESSRFKPLLYLLIALKEKLAKKDISLKRVGTGENYTIFLNWEKFQQFQ